MAETMNLEEKISFYEYEVTRYKRYIREETHQPTKRELRKTLKTFEKRLAELQREAA